MAKVNSSEVINKYKNLSKGYVSSGNILLDLLLTGGKGIPLGKYIEFTSPTGLGKSTTLLHICSYFVNKMGKKIVYLDFEEGVTEDIMVKMNLMNAYEEDKFLLRNPITFAGTEEILEEALNDKEIQLVMIDSITAILPSKLKKEDRKKTIEEMEPGLHARIQTALLGTFKSDFKIKKKTCFWVTQRRMNINMRYPSLTREKSGAAMAFEFYMDIRVQISVSHKGKIKKKMQTMRGVEDVEIGLNAEFTCFKNRCGGAQGVSVILPIVYGRGVSNILTLGNVLVDSGLVKQSGSYFIVNFGKYEDVKCQGYVNYTKFLKDNYDALFQYIKDNDLVFLIRDV